MLSMLIVLSSGKATAVDHGATPVRRPSRQTSGAFPVIALVCLLAAGCSLQLPGMLVMRSLVSPRSAEAPVADRQSAGLGKAMTPKGVALRPMAGPQAPLPEQRPIRLADTRDVATIRALMDRNRESPAARPRAAGRFAWPLHGQVVNAFGRQPDGRRNDGIDIAAASSIVVAAADGMVVYAGDGVPGYGKMVMISHAEEFTTVYAHAGVLLVAAGDHVAQGQPIARLDGGDGGRSRLHFQLRSASSPVDPTPFLLSEDAVLVSALQPLD